MFVVDTSLFSLFARFPKPSSWAILVQGPVREILSPRRMLLDFILFQLIANISKSPFWYNIAKNLQEKVERYKIAQKIDINPSRFGPDL